MPIENCDSHKIGTKSRTLKIRLFFAAIVVLAAVFGPTIFALGVFMLSPTGRALRTQPGIEVKIWDPYVCRHYQGILEDRTEICVNDKFGWVSLWIAIDYRLPPTEYGELGGGYSCKLSVWELLRDVTILTPGIVGEESGKGGTADP